MTIALTITLKEDWGRNMPEVIIKARRLRGEPDVVGRLTPQQPTASVTITSLNDLILEPDLYTAGMLLDGRKS